MNSIEKSVKTARTNDRISNLSESLITRILSYLPITDAVRTCVLSKHWELKWTLIYDIVVNDTWVKPESFPDCVDRILLLSKHVRYFRLHCRENYPLNRVEQWISAALRRNVQSLIVIYGGSSFVPGLLLPQSLLDNASLRILELRLYCTFRVPSRNCFPNLLGLYLYGVEFQNELPNSDTLLFTFPVLEYLVLKKCTWLNVKFVEIHAPQLKRFRIHPPYKPRAYNDYSIKILGNKLVVFESRGGTPENIILTGSSVLSASLRHVNLSWDPRNAHDLQVLQSLLEGFKSLEDLKLEGWSWGNPLLERGLALPRWDKLRRLNLCGCDLDMGLLLKLLRATPSLKTLILHMYTQCVWPDEYDYEGMESTPSCIVNHLEEVELCYIGVTVSEYRLDKFLLKNGLGLKTFRLCGTYHKKEEILNLLSTFPKASTCLTIVVT